MRFFFSDPGLGHEHAFPSDVAAVQIPAGRHSIPYFKGTALHCSNPGWYNLRWGIGNTDGWEWEKKGKRRTAHVNSWLFKDTLLGHALVQSEIDMETQPLKPFTTYIA